MQGELMGDTERDYDGKDPRPLRKYNSKCIAFRKH
jgi:hypothetical protein